MTALVRYLAWEGDLATPDESGETELAHARMRAKQGAAWAIKRLEGPRFPEPLRYLLVRLRQLRRGLGRDLEGMAPLTWVSLDAFARRAGWDPKPHEVEALFLCDDVIRNPRAYLPEPE